MIKYIEENKNKLSKSSYKKLEEYKNLLIKWNNIFNITTIIEDNEINIKHFEDSIINESYFPYGSNVCEVGSGGGFPSIPLMCVREDLRFTLIESISKKCEFLKICVEKLNLNATVVCERAEVCGQSKLYRESFDVVTARAVAKLNILSEYCLPLVKKGGLFIAYKGSLDEEQEALNAIKILGGKITDKKEYSLSENMGERKVYVIKKINETPIKYPRGNGKERKSPL